MNGKLQLGHGAEWFPLVSPHLKLDSFKTKICLIVLQIVSRGSDSWTKQKFILMVKQ